MHIGGHPLELNPRARSTPAVLQPRPGSLQEPQRRVVLGPTHSYREAVSASRRTALRSVPGKRNGSFSIPTAETRSRRPELLRHVRSRRCLQKRLAGSWSLELGGLRASRPGHSLNIAPERARVRRLLKVATTHRSLGDRLNVLPHYPRNADVPASKQGETLHVPISMPPYGCHRHCLGLGLQR